MEFICNPLWHVSRLTRFWLTRYRAVSLAQAYGFVCDVSAISKHPYSNREKDTTQLMQTLRFRHPKRQDIAIQVTLVGYGPQLIAHLQEAVYHLQDFGDAHQYAWPTGQAHLWTSLAQHFRNGREGYVGHPAVFSANQ
jgi:hypothetical protein